MRAGIGIKLAGALAAIALIAPAGASAATKVYGGTTDGGGELALDVKLNKFGIPKKITEARGAKLPADCETSNSSTVNARVPLDVKVTKNLRFNFAYTDPTYGNKSKLKGEFTGRKLNKVSGTFIYASHYQAEPDVYLPEENCTTPKLAYKVKRNGPDPVLPFRLPR